MSIVNFLVRNFDYLTFICFAHHIKKTFWNVFHYVGFDTFALLLWLSHKAACPCVDAWWGNDDRNTLAGLWLFRLNYYSNREVGRVL